MTHFKAFPARLAPIIDRSTIDTSSPLLLKSNQPATITVRVAGIPIPRVSWYVGTALVQTDTMGSLVKNRDVSTPYYKYSLPLEIVTDELEQGLRIVAKNEHGTDSLLLPIRTYKVFSGVTSSDLNTVMYRRQLSQSQSGSFVLSRVRPADHHSLSSEDWTNWQKEMEQRSRMRSIDDIIDNNSDSESTDATPSDDFRQHNLDVIANNNNKLPASDVTTDQATRSDDVNVRTECGHKRDSNTKRYFSERATVPDNTDALWEMFGVKLSNICRMLLSEIDPEVKCHRHSTPSSLHSVPTPEVDIAFRRQSDPQQTAVTVSDVTRIHGNETTPMSKPSTQRQKPPLPVKPVLPPKPPIAKKPTLNRDKPATSLTHSHPPVVTSSQQSVSKASLSHRSKSESREMSPTVSPPVLCQSTSSSMSSPLQSERPSDSGTCHQPVQRVQSDVTRSIPSSHKVTPTPVSRCSSLSNETRSNTLIKVARSEEFLSRTHIRQSSASPAGSPLPAVRNQRGRSVDLSGSVGDTSTSSSTIGRKTLSKEWEVVTTTTHEELTVVYKPSGLESTPTVTTPLPADNSTTSGSGSAGLSTEQQRIYKSAVANLHLSIGPQQGSGTNYKPVGTEQVEDTKLRSACLAERPKSDVLTCSVDGSGVTRVTHDSTNASNASQLDQLISSLMEIAVEVEEVDRKLTAAGSSPPHTDVVISTAKY